jgi:hypothetical protein
MSGTVSLGGVVIDVSPSLVSAGVYLEIREPKGGKVAVTWPSPEQTRRLIEALQEALSESEVSK